MGFSFTHHKPNFACLRFWFSFWSGSQILGTWQVSIQPGIQTWVKPCSNPLFGPIAKKAETLDPVGFFLLQIFSTWRLKKGVANPTKGFSWLFFIINREILREKKARSRYRNRLCWNNIDKCICRIQKTCKIMLLSFKRNHAGPKNVCKKTRKTCASQMTVAIHC